MYGGQSCVDIDNDLSKYIEPTRKRIDKRLSTIKDYVPEYIYNKQVEEVLDADIHQGMQNICYNLNTMHSRAGQDDLAVLNGNI